MAEKQVKSLLSTLTVKRGFWALSFMTPGGLEEHVVHRGGNGLTHCGGSISVDEEKESCSVGKGTEQA